MCQVVPVAILGDCLSLYGPWDGTDDFSDGEVSDLLTPPGSPSDYDGVMTTSSSRCCSPESDDYPLLKDCMWSAGLSMPGFSSRIGEWSKVDAGRLHMETGVVTSDSTPLASVVAPMSDFELKSKNVSFPEANFVSTPPPSRSQSSSSSVSGVGEETRHAVVSAVANCSASTTLQNIDGCFDDDDDDSSDDVDVVSVGPTPPISNSPSSLVQTSSGSSVVRELLVMPRSSSVLAHVNAMHNYSTVSVEETTMTSSTAAVSWPQRSMVAGSKVDVACRRPAYSAPQSPAAVTHRRQWREKAIRGGEVGSMSMPCSPTMTGALGGSSHHQRIRNHYNHHHQHGTVRHGRRVAPRGGCSDSDDGGGGPVYRRAGTGGKRALHNVLERRRRDHLKWNFETLRSVVPSTAHNSRMPKVAILRRARDFVRHLRSTAERLEAERNRQRSLQQRWQHKLAMLISDEQLSC